MDEAKAALAELVASIPNLDQMDDGTRRVSVFDGLRKAGLPEE